MTEVISIQNHPFSLLFVYFTPTHGTHAGTHAGIFQLSLETTTPDPTSLILPSKRGAMAFVQLT